MLTKYLLLSVFVLMLYCLGSAAFYLTHRNRGVSLVKALTWRIVLAVFLFLFLFVAFHFGWIHPHAVQP